MTKNRLQLPLFANFR